MPGTGPGALWQGSGDRLMKRQEAWVLLGSRIALRKTSVSSSLKEGRVLAEAEDFPLRQAESLRIRDFKHYV